MIIQANGQPVEVFSVHETGIGVGSRSYPALVLRLLEMPTAEQLTALARGNLTIGGMTFTGYTHLSDMVLTLYQMSDEAQQVEELTAQVEQQAKMVVQAQSAAIQAEEQVATLQTEVVTAQGEVTAKTSKLRSIATALPDELAVQHPDLYDPMLYTGEPITAGTRINWRGSIAKANVTLWDREDNDPEHAPDLWTVLQVQGGHRVIPNPIPATETFAPGEIGLWEDGKLYKSIHPSPHAWTPGDYPAAWEVYEP